MKKIQAKLVVGSTFLCASIANAALEEVVVTATKRAESIQDVPVSVAAVSADMMEKVGIGDMEDLSAVVPNFEINSAAVIPNLYIRGLGGGLTHSIEQSVGRFIDFSFSEAHETVGASLRMVSPNDKVTLSLVGRNLGNEKINAWTAPSGPNTIAAMAPPRQVTLKLGLRY